MMLKTIYFDLGNVLVFFSLPKLFEQLAKCTGMAPLEVKQCLFDTDLREKYEKGLINTAQVYQAFQKGASKTFSFQEFTLAFSDIFTPNTELWTVVEALKKEGMRLILLSNTSECHYQYSARTFPVLGLFDHKILSYEVGVWKPDLKIFQKALDQAQCRPEECFYTDDVPEFIESARKAGLQGKIFTSVVQLKKDLAHRGCNNLL